MIRAAAEFADTIERDAQTVAGAQLFEDRGRGQPPPARPRTARRRSSVRLESERQRAEMLNATRNETRELLAKAHADATRELQEAEARAAACSSSRAIGTEPANAMQRQGRADTRVGHVHKLPPCSPVPSTAPSSSCGPGQPVARKRSDRSRARSCAQRRAQARPLARRLLRRVVPPQAVRRRSPRCRNHPFPLHRSRNHSIIAASSARLSGSFGPRRRPRMTQPRTRSRPSTPAVGTRDAARLRVRGAPRCWCTRRRPGGRCAGWLGPGMWTMGARRAPSDDLAMVLLEAEGDAGREREGGVTRGRSRIRIPSRPRAGAAARQDAAGEAPAAPPVESSAVEPDSDATVRSTRGQTNPSPGAGRAGARFRSRRRPAGHDNMARARQTPLQ